MEPKKVLTTLNPANGLTKEVGRAEQTALAKFLLRGVGLARRVWALGGALVRSEHKDIQHVIFAWSKRDLLKKEISDVQQNS